MSEEAEIGIQTLDSSSETIELRFRQEVEMVIPVNETSTDALTLRSVDERIKQATGPLLRRVEELCALLRVAMKWIPLVTAKRRVRGEIMSL